MGMSNPVPAGPSLKDQKKQIDIEVRRAELELKKLELRKATADATTAELAAELKEISLGEYRRNEAARKASEGQRYVFAFDDEVSNFTVEQLSDWLKNRTERFPGQELTVYVNSPGGSIYAGFVAMDAIREAISAGNPVTVKVTGMAASMAGVIAQAATTRLIGRHSELMLHSGSTFALGKSFEIEDTSKHIERLTRKVLTAYAERSDGKWDVDRLFEKVHNGRKDWWLTADEAVENGFMDGTF